MSAEQAKQFAEQATQSLQGGQFEQALELIDQAIALNPMDSESHVLRGIALASLGQPEAAKEAFRKAIQIHPYNAKAYYNLGVLEYQRGDKHEARSMAEEAVKIDNKHAGAKQLISQIDRELSPNVGISTGGTIVDPNDILAGKVGLAAGAPPPGTGMAPPPGTGMAPPPGTSGSEMAPPGTGMGATPPTAAPGPMAPPPGAAAPPSTPPTTGAPMTPPPASGPVPPAGQPYQQTPPGQYSQPPQGYGYQPTRPGYGYEQPSGHAISFIGGMGNAWTIIGWVIPVIGVVAFLIQIPYWGELFNYMQAVMANPNNPPPQPDVNMAGTILGYTSIGLSIIYVILDLVDRRGNFVWLVPTILGNCCCGFGFLFHILYMAVGRR